MEGEGEKGAGWASGRFSKLTCQSTDIDFLIARMRVQGYSLQVSRVENGVQTTPAPTPPLPRLWERAQGSLTLSTADSHLVDSPGDIRQQIRVGE